MVRLLLNLKCRFEQEMVCAWSWTVIAFKEASEVWGRRQKKGSESWLRTGGCRKVKAGYLKQRSEDWGCQSESCGRSKQASVVPQN